MELIMGLVTGVIFGFLLQKGEVLRFEKQLGFMLLRDMTIIKFMFSAVLVGMLGIYVSYNLGLIDFSIKATNVGAIALGGALFGVGWAIAGFCPGTSVGALAEGRIHAFWAILGMMSGAALYAEMFPYLKKTVLTLGNYGKITLPQVLNISPWPVIAVFILVGLAMFAWFEKKGL
nr:DUF6691 family protein [uncultured Desulfobulbus sp.]